MIKKIIAFIKKIFGIVEKDVTAIDTTLKNDVEKDVAAMKHNAALLKGVVAQFDKEIKEMQQKYGTALNTVAEVTGIASAVASIVELLAKL
jgi:prophage DNA circulation protein